MTERTITAAIWRRLIFNLVVVALAVAQLCVGVANIGRCAAETRIPVYLVGTYTRSIVGTHCGLELMGNLGINAFLGFAVTNLIVVAIDIIFILFTLPSLKSTTNHLKRCYKVFYVSRVFIGAGWLIAGSLFVYYTSPTYKDESAYDFCDYTTYWFAFAVTTLANICYGLLLFCGIPVYILYGSDETTLES